MNYVIIFGGIITCLVVITVSLLKFNTRSEKYLLLSQIGQGPWTKPLESVKTVLNVLPVTEPRHKYSGILYAHRRRYNYLGQHDHRNS